MPSREKTEGRVLVVDDDEHTRGLLKDLCESSGYEVAVASDGDEAFDRINRSDPDIVLLDVMMPKEDGFSLLRRVRGTPHLSELPIILLTAVPDMEAKIRGIELGANDYVTKPFKLFELQVRIRAALAASSYRSQLKAAEQELAELKDSDPLTGAGTYAQLRVGLGYEFNRARRYGRPLSAMVISVDDFQSARPALGTKDGDQLVRDIGDALKKALRAPDRLFRLDVDEFVALLPETDGEGGKRAAERILQTVSAANLGVEKLGAAVSVSIGVANHPNEGVQRPEDLIRLAAAALGKARSRGPSNAALASE